MKRILVPSTLAITALAVAASSCESNTKASEKPVPEAPQAAAIAPEEPAPVLRRSELRPYRPLLDEVSRAEVAARGPFIDLGDSATHKWTRGRWKNAWGDNGKDAETTYTEVAGARVRFGMVVVPQDDPAAEIVMRARSKCSDSAKAEIRVDGKAIGTVELSKEWGEIRAPAGDAFKAPDEYTQVYRELELYVPKGCSGPRAEIDWVWVSTETGGKAPQGGVRQGQLELGKVPRRGIFAHDARSYRWYLDIPQKAELVFDYASEASDAKFMVRVSENGGETKTIFEQAGTKEWQEGAVDLSAYAGKTVRLEIARSGADGTSGWAEPEIMLSGEAPPPPPDGGKPKNVIVILIDTIRADVFEPIGGEGSLVKTPVFDALSKESTVFTTAYTPENWTKPSVASVLTGLYPSTHGTKADADTVSQDADLLSEQLKAAGFETASFVANGYVSEKYGFLQGWDAHTNYIRQSLNSSAENVYDDAIEWVEKRKDKDKPFFLYIQTIDPHVPYKVDEKYTNLYHPNPYPKSIGRTLSGKHQQEIRKKPLPENELAWVKALYFGEVTYHDEHMGRFLEDMRTRGILDNSLLVITNDHGEELNEHDKLGHGHSLYDEVIRAPLLMRFPGRFEAGAQIADPVELIDIAPTVLDVLGMEPAEDHDGFSLMPLVEGAPLTRPYYAMTEFLEGQRSVRVGSWKMIVSGNSTQLFHIPSDPTEQKELSDTHAIPRRMCDIHIAEGLAIPNKRARALGTRLTKKKFEPGVVEMDPQLRKQLDALGYFGDD